MGALHRRFIRGADRRDVVTNAASAGIARVIRRLVTALAILSLLPLPQVAFAQGEAQPTILRDAETEALFADMSRDIIRAAGLSPVNVHVVLINDESINAFTAGGQTVYIHSGLLAAAENANQVQGVIAHEIGHIADGHVVLADRAMRPALGITLLSMLVGVAAMAAGAGDAGAGIMAAGQQAAMGHYLSFSRNQESTADASAATYLAAAHISGRGFLSFFHVLRNEEYSAGTENIDPYAQTHPLSSERIATLTATLQASPYWDATPDPALQVRFLRVKAKLMGYVAEYQQTLRRYPETDRSVYAHYARAYAWHKAGYPDRADAESLALLAADPRDPYFQEIRGQILLEGGHPVEALVPLRAATQGSRNSPLIATTFGHALIATEDAANYPEAIRVLRTAVARDNDNPFGWLELGTAYERTGDEPRAMLATAERASMTGDMRTASVAARGALGGLPANSADWIRAQDIAMAAQNEMNDHPNQYRNRR